MQQFKLVSIYSVQNTKDEIWGIFSTFLHSHAALFTLHHSVANYMNILQLNNVASSEAHYLIQG